MSEKVSIKEITGNEILGRAILSAISNGKRLEDFGIVTAQPGVAPEDVTKEIEIEFRVNGVPVSLRDVLNEWGKQNERMIQEQAARFIKDKLGDLENRLCRFSQEIKSRIVQHFPEIDEETWRHL